jgi:hypothetical protein
MGTLKKISITAMAALLTMAGTLFVAESSRADPPPWAPAHGYRQKQAKTHYRYIYYPASQVYFAPERGGYYYLDNGGWTFGATLPPRINLGRSVSIDLGGPVPYAYHPVVLQRYPVVVVP